MTQQTGNPQTAPQDGATEPFTVYYVIGRPRSGSTFVGDYIARRLDIPNAGEVWQTFRSVKAVDDQRFEKGRGRWVRPQQRAAKNAEIFAHPFWSALLARPEQDPYAALVAEARERANGLVDCSKTTNGVACYEALGCKVVVVHTIRAYSTWARSMRTYHKTYGLSEFSSLKLLSSYVRGNLDFRKYQKSHPYCIVPLENLSVLEIWLATVKPSGCGAQGYVNCEMFGAPGFSGTYDSSRATGTANPFDRALYRLFGVWLREN